MMAIFNRFQAIILSIALWTVPHLTSAMDGWTAVGRSPSAQNRLGQVIKKTSDLTTDVWPTARMDNALDHTAHSADDYIFSLSQNGKIQKRFVAAFCRTQTNKFKRRRYRKGMRWSFLRVLFSHNIDTGFALCRYANHMGNFNCRQWEKVVDARQAKKKAGRNYFWE